MSELVLHIDFETASAADLQEVGVHKYAEHWTTHVLMMAYRFGETGPIPVWYYWEPFPDVVRDHVIAGGMVGAHNATFERTLWNVCLRRPGLVRGTPALDLPWLKVGQMTCTMARAATINLPQGLDHIANVTGAPFRKDDEGKKLMLQYCRPSRISLPA